MSRLPTFALYNSSFINLRGSLHFLIHQANQARYRLHLWQHGWCRITGTCAIGVLITSFCWPGVFTICAPFRHHRHRWATRLTSHCAAFCGIHPSCRPRLATLRLLGKCWRRCTIYTWEQTEITLTFSLILFCVRDTYRAHALPNSRHIYLRVSPLSVFDHFFRHVSE